MRPPTVRKLKVWDKAKWHLDGEFPKDPSAENAARHIFFMLQWLQQKGLTTPDGDDEAEGSGKDVSINSEMVSDQGRAFLDKYYDRWLEQLDYRKKKCAPRLLGTFWKEFQRDKPTNKAKEKTGPDRLFNHLKRKARRNEVEVEDLLRIASKGTAESASILRQLQTQYSWNKTLERWVANICLYLEKGPRTLVGLILDERQPKVDREMAIVVLETVNTPDSAKCRPRFETGPELRFGMEQGWVAWRDD